MKKTEYFVFIVLGFILVSILTNPKHHTVTIYQLGPDNDALIRVTCSDNEANLAWCNVTSPCSNSCAVSGSSATCTCTWVVSQSTPLGSYDACGVAGDTQGATSSNTCLDTVIVKECGANFVCPSGKYCDKSTGTCRDTLPCPTESSILQVSISGSSQSPCTGNPITTWIDCSAIATVSCSNCNSNSLRYKVFSSNPGTCPTTYCDYINATSVTITNRSWVCGYGENNTGSIGVSSPIEFKINKIFTFNVTAKAYDDKGYVMKNELVSVYLCNNDVVFCNSDAQYIKSGSTISNDQGWFTVVLAAELEKAVDYKIGVVTSKGYAEAVVRT